MHATTALLIAPVLFAHLQGPAPHPFDLQKAFERASKSVVVVHCINKHGEEVALGSGIILAPGEVVTNAHVVLDGTGAYLTKGSDKWEVKEIFLDPKLDLALLKTDTLPLPPVKLGISTQVRPGQKLFAIGNPQGLELSLSDGIVSAIRVSDEATYIQTTTPISPGSSGGGVFNTRGDLVGITTFMMRDGQNLNFAIAADHLALLRLVHTELKIAKSQKMIIPREQFIDFTTINKMSNEELTVLAIKNNPIAQEQLGIRLDLGNDILGEQVISITPDHYRATFWSTKAAEHGSNIAAALLVNDYINGLNRKKDLSEAKRLARQMVSNLDSNYNIYTNTPLSNLMLKQALSSAARAMCNVLATIYIEGDRRPEFAMETLIWAEINAKLIEEDLASRKPDNSNGIGGFLERQNKSWIDVRDNLYESESKFHGIPFVDEARDRAKALMRAYGVVD